MEKCCIYTVGYTLFQNGNQIDVDRMFQVLKGFNVNFLIDVRSVPYSKQYPQCNAENLKMAGKKWGITYGHMPEIGAKASDTQEVFSKACDIFFDDVFPISKSNRPENTELQASDEIVDFHKFRADECFINGLKRLETACLKGFTLALMCSEKNPVSCHRYFLISKALEMRFGAWLEVKHIVEGANGTVSALSNKDLDAQLREAIFRKNEIKKLDVLSCPFPEDGEEPMARIENYFGASTQEKIFDFCDRYWNLMHGWKRAQVAAFA